MYAEGAWSITTVTMVTCSLIYPEWHWFKTADQSESRISCDCKQTRAGCVVVSGQLTASHLSAVDFNDVVWPYVCVVRWAAQVAGETVRRRPGRSHTACLCPEKTTVRCLLLAGGRQGCYCCAGTSTETHFNDMTTFYSRINKYSEETWSWRRQFWCHIWECQYWTQTGPTVIKSTSVRVITLNWCWIYFLFLLSITMNALFYDYQPAEAWEYMCWIT